MLMVPQILKFDEHLKNEIFFLQIILCLHSVYTKRYSTPKNSFLVEATFKDAQVFAISEPFHTFKLHTY